MALTCGSIFPVTISIMSTGMVLFNPATNQATANSSNETAAVRQRDEIIAGFVKGIITLRTATHSVAPRFHAAASSCGSMSFNRNRIIAMANGMVSTVWAAIIDHTCPDIPILANQASIANAMIIRGIVGGSNASAKNPPLPKNLYL